MPDVVVLIPAFNAAGTLAATLESVQAQGASLERISAVYVADDHSQDATTEVARAAWRAPIPLHILRGERNLGERGNVNRAMTVLGDGPDWVLLLHADDLVSPRWLEMMLRQMEAASPDVASISSSWDTSFSDGSVALGEDDPSRPVEVIAGTAEAVRATLLRGCWWHISGCAIRVRAFHDIGPFHPDLPQTGDWEWLLRCLHRGWTVEYVPRTLILYQQHPRSVSTTSFRQDRDIEESLQVVAQYTYLLSKRDLCVFHLDQGQFAVRRLGRAALHRDARRCLRTCRTLALIGRSLAHCLERAAPDGRDCRTELRPWQ